MGTVLAPPSIVPKRRTKYCKRISIGVESHSGVGICSIGCNTDVDGAAISLKNFDFEVVNSSSYDLEERRNFSPFLKRAFPWMMHESHPFLFFKIVPFSSREKSFGKFKSFQTYKFLQLLSQHRYFQLPTWFNFGLEIFWNLDMLPRDKSLDSIEQEQRISRSYFPV